LPKLAARGIKKLLVICPSFVSDCLETLEEIGIRARATFLGAGGTELTLIPCLNEHPLWLETLQKMIGSFSARAAVGNAVTSVPCHNTLTHRREFVPKGHLRIARIPPG